MVNFQNILDLIDKKCFNGLINGHDVQLGGHKFHKNGKNQKNYHFLIFTIFVQFV